jgi:hypothetical protein
MVYGRVLAGPIHLNGKMSLGRCRTADDRDVPSPLVPVEPASVVDGAPAVTLGVDPTWELPGEEPWQAAAAMKTR